jgi:hypothetical protein
MVMDAILAIIANGRWAIIVTDREAVEKKNSSCI